MIAILGPGKIIHHSVRADFGALLRAALVGETALAGLGPIYEVDPANAILPPFFRSAREIGLDPDTMTEFDIAPLSVLDRARRLRCEELQRWSTAATDVDWTDAGDWTRAGLVLEVASRLGIPLRDRKPVHVKWKMRGTVTGRFGVESGGFNPLIIAREKPNEPTSKSLWRDRIVPSSEGRSVVSLDFRAMDLSSMVAVVPNLYSRYVGAIDLHERTAQLVGIDRDVAKNELFVHAYGGRSEYSVQFERTLPELNWLRSKPHGEGARLVQKTSAIAFRAALSRALPFLVGDLARPMFAVHDELALDVLSGDTDGLAGIVEALEAGASRRIGVPYRVGVRSGNSYAEAKRESGEE